MRSNILCKNNNQVLQEWHKKSDGGLQDRAQLLPWYVRLITCWESAFVFKTLDIFPCYKKC